MKMSISEIKKHIIGHMKASVGFAPKPAEILLSEPEIDNNKIEVNFTVNQTPYRVRLIQNTTVQVMQEIPEVPDPDVYE